MAIPSDLQVKLKKLNCCSFVIFIFEVLFNMIFILIQISRINEKSQKKFLKILNENLQNQLLPQIFPSRYTSIILTTFILSVVMFSHHYLIIPIKSLLTWSGSFLIEELDRVLWSNSAVPNKLDQYEIKGPQHIGLQVHVAVELTVLQLGKCG